MTYGKQWIALNFGVVSVRLVDDVQGQYPDLLS